MDFQMLIGLLIGLVAGAAGAWALLRGQRQSAIDSACAPLQSQIAGLTERLLSRDESARAMQLQIETLSREQTNLNAQLQVQSERRATAEQRATRIPELEAQLAEQQRVMHTLQGEFTLARSRESELLARLEQERKTSEEKVALLTELRQGLSDNFKALSGDALRSNNQQFLDLARSTLEQFQQSAQADLTSRQLAIDNLVKPLSESLTKVEGKIEAIESQRVSAYATLSEQVKSLVSTQNQLQIETGNLVKALRAPQVRGRWGEIQLKRVVEMAGMVDHCDFETQVSVDTEAGRLRPDMIVRLPGGKNIVVDSKCPLDAYLEALACTDDTARAVQLDRHARQVADHVKSLAMKQYWSQFSPAPEFVVLFLPGEVFFSAALERNPSLIQVGVEQKVILATPTTLIALLKVVSYGWTQEATTQNIRQISELGQTLYDRICKLADYFAKLGTNLNRSVESYNEAMKSLQSRVLSSARKFSDLGMSSHKELESPELIEKTAMIMQSDDRDENLLPAPADRAK